MTDVDVEVESARQARVEATSKPLSQVIADAATKVDSAEWSTVLVGRAAVDVDEIEAFAQARRVDLDRWFTVRVNDAFGTFSGDVLAGALEQLTTACEVGLYAIDMEAADKIARRALRDTRGES